MRVIAGIAKGIPLKAPKGMNTRPTTDRIKEALFNIIGPKVIDACFLDLFAGSGGIGIEALSRGAEQTIFIEKDSNAIHTIKSNLVFVKLEEFGEVYRNDIGKALAVLGKKGSKFDIIFMDPPYEREFEEDTLHKIANNNLLKPNGMIIIETSKRTILPECIDNFKLFRQESYGDTLLNFYGFE